MPDLNSCHKHRATLPEALELANAAALIVVHQLGTTGSAAVTQLPQLEFGER